MTIASMEFHVLQENSRLRHWWLRILLCCSSTLLASCSGLFFIPDKQLVLYPDRIGLEYRNISIETEDGERLNGWLLPGRPPVKGTVVFLHGNAQNISYHIAGVYWLPEQHYNVYIYDYRGFGRSTGKATIENSIDDFAAVMQQLQREIPQREQRFIVFGQSLGAALAIAAVARFKERYPICRLVADSPFSGFRRIAREKLEAVFFTRPLSGLLAYAFTDSPDLLRSISEVSPVPLLLIHGLDDDIVPPHHSKLLFDAARPPKALWLEPGAKHIQSLAHEVSRKRLVAYFKECTARRAPAAERRSDPPPQRQDTSTEQR